jgi:hypothetical protein
MSDTAEEDFVDETIYIRMTEDEHTRLHESLATAMNSMEWVTEEIAAVMHKGKHPTAALLAIKAIVDEYESGLSVMVMRNLEGDVVIRYVQRP